MKFLIIASLAESLINFRGPLIKALQARGFQVHIAAPDLPNESPTRLQLQAADVVVHEIPLRRTGTNPISDFKSFFSMWRLMRNVRPDQVLGYTVKPVIYGTLSAWLAGIPRRFALITGLGYSFNTEKNQRNWRQAIAQRLYSLALTRAHVVFFQNPDDEALFRDRALLKPNTRTCVVNGSGVDTNYFEVTPIPSGPPCFLMIARLLGDKGVREYANAAHNIRAIHPKIRCLLVGWIDSNPEAISQRELDAWVESGTLEYLGHLPDVRPAIAQCSVYVLPSYREGTPRTVLEAMAMGRAIITTDAPGCRETVHDGVNGFLIPIKSVDALEKSMMRFINDQSISNSMGNNSRKIAEKRFDVHKVNTEMLQAMDIN